MQLTVLLIIALLILIAAVFGAISDKPWRFTAFCILVGMYCLIQQLPTGK